MEQLPGPPLAGATPENVIENSLLFVSGGGEQLFDQEVVWMDLQRLGPP